MKKILFSLCFILLELLSSAQQQSQSVKGIVLDRVSEKPLSGATVRIEGLSLQSLTDANGQFIFRDVPAGRIQLTVSYSGYQGSSLSEVLVTAGKEVVLEITLEQQVTTLAGITLRSSRKGTVNNEYAAGSARSFNLEEVTRYAGGRNDPSKLVSNFAGVISNNDSRNDIVVRGNSPAGVLWRIEGLPAPNPNHFATLGTTGGPVTILNTNALKTSDFYTGAFPAEYGNATAAVFDISLRAGNSEKQERTLQLNLFSGLEAMFEGPLGKKKKGASYLLGYRYSFVQLGQSLGLDVGTEAVPRYQDWVFHIQSAAGKAGRFSFYGMGGNSKIDFIGSKIDTTDFYSRKDQDSYFTTNLYLFGAKHVLNLGPKSFLRSTVSFSNTRTNLETEQYPLPVPPYGESWPVTNVNERQQVLRFSSILNTKRTARFSWRTGFTGEQTFLRTLVKDRQGLPAAAAFKTLRNFDDRFLLLQYFTQARYKPAEKLVLTAGMHGMYFTFNKRSIIEPRASISYLPHPKHTIALSYGLHGQAQPLPVYLYEQETAVGPDRSNRDLDFSKAHHVVLSYEYRFGPDWKLRAELYLQSLFDIPVERAATGFSMLNAGSDFTFPEKAGLVNRGKGKNQGLELTVEKSLRKGYYLLFTGSIFESTYKGSDDITRNSSFNYGYATNILGGSEWKTGRQQQNAFTLDIRLSATGGRYITPVNISASLAAGKEVPDESRYNAEQLDGYFRLDTKFGFRLNSKKRKRSHSFYLDLQNVTNRENIFLRRFNPVYGTVGNVNQIGFFPDILYRVQF